MVFAAGATVLAAGTACRGEKEDTPVPAPVALKVAFAPLLSSAPLILAHESGFFDAEGIDLEFVQTDLQTGFPSMVSGSIDVFTGPVGAALFNAVARGAAIRIVADKGHLSPSACVDDAFVLRAALLDAHPAGRTESLRGLKIFSREGTIREYELEKLLARGGLVKEDIEIVNVPINSRVDALETGACDLLPLQEPHLSHAVSSGIGVGWIPTRDLVPEFPIAVIVFGERLIGPEREVGNRFVRAYLRGVALMGEGKSDRNIDLMVRGTGLEPDLLRETCWPAVREDGSIDLPSLREFAEWVAAKGYADRVPEQQEYWDPSFIEWAAANPWRRPDRRAPR